MACAVARLMVLPSIRLWRWQRSPRGSPVAWSWSRSSRRVGDAGRPQTPHTGPKCWTHHSYGRFRSTAMCRVLLVSRRCLGFPHRAQLRSRLALRVAHFAPSCTRAHVHVLAFLGTARAEHGVSCSEREDDCCSGCDWF
jgi:hypothetical protein